jgi:uncharacterized membrane protein YdbT with pleckstrin-like domain
VENARFVCVERRQKMEQTVIPDADIVWEASPSQWTNFPAFLLFACLSFLIIPLFLIVYRYLVTKYTRYMMTEQRLFLRTGILNRTTKQIELYRIRNYILEEPFFLRLFGLSNILLVAADEMEPTVLLQGVRNGDHLITQIRDHAQSARLKNGVRDIEMTGYQG